MCDTPNPEGRRGDRLEHGTAHGLDHRRWSRRSFLHAVGLATGVGLGRLAGVPVRIAAAPGPFTAPDTQGTDRVLVLVQLNGGNDGLNTVIPYRQDPYFSLRPTIAIPYHDILKITSETGLHPALGAFAGRFSEGSLAIVQGVGYEQPDLSHFRSTDIWLSGRSGTAIPDSGWAGRVLEEEFRDAGSLAYPLAVQLGATAPLLTLGLESQVGMSVQSIELFERLAGTGQAYPTAGLGDGPLADQVRFVRTVANDSYRYAGALQEANSGVENNVGYPAGSGLATQLAIVSRLIRGGLGARVYHVSIGGFDTHAGQAGTHAALLTALSAALEAFFADLDADGAAGRVLVATFSEFGRRVRENGSAGTDHGTSAPMLLVGPGVRGGLHGVAPDLSDLDPGGNLRPAVDFRAVFGSLLRDWFGTPDPLVDTAMGADWPELDLVDSPTGTGLAPYPARSGFVVEPAFPNPTTGQAVLPLSLDRNRHVRVEAFDAAGRLVAVPHDGEIQAGRRHVTLDVRSWPAGTYILRATAGPATLSRALVVAR